jgi:modification methylase
VAFNVLIEAGHVKPGDVLHDAKRRHKAIVRADGTLVADGQAGSIHKVGAHVQGLDACIGWTFWHVESADGLTLIDEFRATIRKELARAG